MVTKMRKKIHSLLGTKNSLQGLWSGGGGGGWRGGRGSETRTLGAKNSFKSKKKAQFYDVKY